MLGLREPFVSYPPLRPMGEIVATVFRGIPVRRMMLWALGYCTVVLAAFAFWTA